jgi:hypothetical protein
VCIDEDDIKEIKRAYYLLGYTEPDPKHWNYKRAVEIIKKIKQEKKNGLG